MNSVRAIPVTYHDVKFRSMTEAKMAIFFDLLGFQYEYEPEKFEVYTKFNYIPDFVIHNVYGRLCGKKMYIECKGSELTDREWQKLVLFADFKKKTPSRPFLLVTDFFWAESVYRAQGYIASIKARRPRNVYGSWFHALFTVCNEKTSDIAILCKDKDGNAAVMSENEFYSDADVKATLEAFSKTREANFGKNHTFTGFSKSKLPLDINFNLDDIPEF